MPARTAKTQKPKQVDAQQLLAWYDVHRRTLPWRARAGRKADPYHVWLSEIMLQQTTVQAVGAYYVKFLKAWPTIGALAAAEQDAVLTAWAGLGYYARARNLHAAAKVVAQEMGGEFPRSYEGLRGLPGVGDYTAGAIAAIAFDLPHAAMDANAERVIARVFAITEALPKSKSAMRAALVSLVPERRAGDFAQALMDLGSAICTPKRPACANCPWAAGCLARARGIQETLPVKGPKMVRPLKRGAAFVARDASGAVLLVKRPEKGLLGGMMEPPLGPWSEDFPATAEAMKQAPFKAAWKKRGGIVEHGFTHFQLEIEVYAAEVDAAKVGGQVKPGHGEGGKWVRDLSTAALPTVMKKIVEHAFPDEGPLFAR
ncbi:MAG TPA: A/G-specific adenine glycosylase [Rhizomicrobium sp.]|jgi:A/G-specific adenine glycosylase|nr:A/G-specific adenine glycosylase [Rhizomicrobium sp.]